MRDREGKEILLNESASRKEERGEDFFFRGGKDLGDVVCAWSKSFEARLFARCRWILVEAQVRCKGDAVGTDSV